MEKGTRKISNFKFKTNKIKIIEWANLEKILNSEKPLKIVFVSINFCE